MNAFSPNDMIKALRLTREGRLKTAMAKLRTVSGPAPTLPSLPELPAVLKKMVERLGELGGAAADLPTVLSPASAPAPRTPNGGRFEDRNYADSHGRLAYKLFIPTRYQGAPLPLVVMLHGCTQSPDDFAAGTRMNQLAEAQGFLVAYPAQPRAANAQKCWNWFSPENQRRDHGEAALTAGITRQITTDFAIHPSRIYVAGLSAGGALAAIMGATYPDLYAAVGVHSGLACGAAHDVTSAFMAMTQGGPTPTPYDQAAVRTIVFHGDRDHTVNLGNAAQVIGQARAGAALDSRVIEGTTAGTAYTRTIDTNAAGRPMLEQWILHKAGHAWSGGDPAGSFTDPKGPDASKEMLRFFLEQKEPA